MCKVGNHQALTGKATRLATPVALVAAILSVSAVALAQTAPTPPPQQPVALARRRRSRRQRPLPSLAAPPHSRHASPRRRTTARSPLRPRKSAL
jgi:hypothetical protein